MAMSLEELRQQLSAIEPDESMYQGIGSEEVPLLQQLLNDEEAWMAARAVYALGRIKDTQATRILSQTVQHERIEVRVALATTTPLLPAATANRILTRLLSDQNPGVRHLAIQSVPTNPPQAIQKLVQEIADHDPVEFVRLSAEDSAMKLRSARPGNHEQPHSS